MILDLEKMRKIASNSTNCSWYIDEDIEEGSLKIRDSDCGRIVCSFFQKGGGYLKNAEFISTFNPAVILLMIDEINKLSCENEKLKNKLEERDNGVF